MLTLADTLAVEQAYVTVATRNLIKKGYIKTIVDKTDKRAKLISITKKGKLLVSVVERDLQKEMNKMAEGLVLEDVATYIEVMHSIAAKLKKSDR